MQRGHLRTTTREHWIKLFKLIIKLTSFFSRCAHCAEECKNPATVVPRAISTALTFTYVAGWLFNIVLCFCMGDPNDILASQIAQPVVQIFYNVMGPGAAIFFAVAGFMVMNFVCITAMHAGARTVWAYSRDELLPGSKIWYKVWKVSGTPVIAVWLYAVLCILINLVGLGSYITIAAIFNICAIALDWSYCIPVLCKLLFGKFEPGPWHLGKASPFINAWAIAWTSFVSIIFLFPTVMPVAADNVGFLSCKFAIQAAFIYFRRRPPRFRLPLVGFGGSFPIQLFDLRLGSELTVCTDELRGRLLGVCARRRACLLVHSRKETLHGSAHASAHRRRLGYRGRGREAAGPGAGGADAACAR